MESFQRKKETMIIFFCKGDIQEGKYYSNNKVIGGMIKVYKRVCSEDSQENI